MKLSACLIVKDEAENLPRCLASLQGKVDEIVVVDTGSTDGTVAIAEAAGAKVGHFPWCDDFAAARNAAIDLATGDWILIIDADEELAVPDPAGLAALVAGEPAAYLVPLADVLHGQAEGRLGSVVRLFPRLPELRFDGRIHESIGAGMTKLGLPLGETNALRLTHHGYRPEVMLARGKAGRNLKLARLMAEERPERPLSWFDLGRSAITANRLPEALAAWERLRALPPSDPYQPQYLATLEQMCKQLADEYVRHCQRLAGATITACLIVKDEADQLPRCLASLRGVVDEIVVVDTGSTDDTVRLARQAGAKVGHFAWCEDFAAARNAALDLATGDWVLVIDADEELAVPDPMALRAAVAGEAGAYMLEIQNLDADGNVESRYASAPRLFRRDPAVRFTGRLHEDVTAALQLKGWAARPLPGVAIRHHGYVPAVVAARGKVERNRRLAEAMTRDRPDDAEPWFHLAAICWRGRDAEGALDAADRALARIQAGKPLPRHRQVALAVIRAGALSALGKDGEALAALDRGLALHPGHPELAYERGVRRAKQGDVAGATADFEACVAAHGHPSENVLRSGITSFLPRAELAGLAAQAGRFEDAAAHMQAALADPDCPVAERQHLQAMAREFAALAASQPGAPAGRAALLARLEANPRDAGGFLELAFECFQAGEHDRAVVALGRSLELEAAPTAYYLLGLTLLDLGQPGWAERCFMAVMQLDPDHPQAMDARMEARARPPAAPLPPELDENFARLLALAEPRLTACMIVKNEAEDLPRALASLQGLVDEIVVLDTGSTDGTVQIAEAAGAKVGHFTWVDDFAAARNAATELASGDWVLIIDADEELEVDDHRALPAAMRRRIPAAYVVAHVNLDATGAPALEVPSVRLFQRQAGIRYQGRLHETVEASLDELGWPVEALPTVRVLHHGIVPEVVAARGKPERNRRIAELAAQDAPSDPVAWFNLALARVGAEDWDAAREAFERLDALPGGVLGLARSRRAHAVVHWAMMERQQGRLAEAEAVLDRALAVEPGFPEFLYERGLVRAARGNRQGAIADLEACQVDPAPFAGLPMRAGITDVLPQAALAEVQRAPARSGLRIAGGARPAPTEAPRPIAARPQRSAATASGALDEAFKAFQAGQLDEALASITRSLEIFTSPTAYMLLGLTLMELGHPDWAERAFLAVLRLKPDHEAAAEARLEARARGAGPKPAEDRLALLRRLLAMAEPRLSACLIVKDEAENLPRCLASLQGKVDEIVVVDTGSTDGTVAIAEAAGAKVGHFPWCDDFAAARNAALDLATGDWVLIIDADEELVVDDAEMLANALCWRLNGGYLAKLTNLAADGTEESQAPVMRLFQRLPELRYRGRLHENVSEGLRALAWPVPELRAIRLLHHGYRAAAVAGRGKGERNLRLASLDAAERPDSTVAQVNLARSLALDGKADEALAILDGVADGAGGLADGDYLMYVLSYQDQLRRAGRFADAEDLLTAALGRLPGHPDFLFERGNVRFRLGRKADARADFEACLGAAPGIATVRPGVTDEMPRLALAQLERARLSACLIVKDEAENLPRCLASLQGKVDEIVVVDTGSTDGTVAIAEAAGATIGHFAWTGNFGAARNASLDLATGDWALIIDADEELVVEDAEAFRAALERPELGAYIFPIHNLKDDGSFQVQPMMRLFRRHDAVRFAGRLHEEATRAIEGQGWRVEPLPGVHLRHHGYLSAAIVARNKWGRNFEIAIAEVEANPDSPLAWYNMARSSLFTGQTGPAGEAFTQVARLLAAGVEMGEAPYCNYVMLRKRLLPAAEAEALLDEGLGRVPGFPEFLYERALLRRDRGDVAGAITDLRACLQPLHRLYTAAMRPEVRGSLAPALLAELGG